MIVITVNSGSTSIKLGAFALTGDASVRRIEHDQHSGEGPAPAEVLRNFFAKLPEKPAAIAHRVVHGGTRFTKPVAIDSKVLGEIGKLSELAPLHNPKALEWIDAARHVAGRDVPQVAAFDTSFFSSLPRVAGEYALAKRFGTDEGVRRYGFHGLAHEALFRRWSKLNPDLPQGGRLISLQMGGGCSAAAIERGKPLDISMGFSPLEGLVMATRSGDVDAAIVPYLERRLAMTADEIVALLNKEAGISGLAAGETNLGKLANDRSPESQFAVDLYCYRVRKYIGAYLAVLGGADGIVFGGGVGEHVPAVRARILTGMEWAGITIDSAANTAARGQEARIDASTRGGGEVLSAGLVGGARVYVIPVEEEEILVDAARTVLKSN